MKLRCLFLIACLILAGSVPAAFGQARGGITGIVTDETGAVLPGADVALTNQAMEADVRRTVTSDEGFFSIPALRAGTYTLEVEMPGFNLWRSPKR